MTTIDPEEVEKFSKIAADWWKTDGKFAPLHKFNPARIAYLKARICECLGLDGKLDAPFKGLKLLDIGCGGGLLSEPLTRLGFSVTGIDASEQNIKTAMQHAKEQNLKIDYKCSAVEELSKRTKYDVVLNMEVIEHVKNPCEFLSQSASLLKPKGLMFVATINRTAKSLFLAKFAAEYILNWLPHGTHDWNKFKKPSEIVEYLKNTDLKLVNQTGLTYNLCKKNWNISPDISQNYIMTFQVELV